MKCNLKAHRAGEGYNQQEFADSAGISVAHLSMLENDKRLPSLMVAYQIADMLGVGIGDLWPPHLYLM
jgi:DNA-binding XRE family transcriptional regulator